MISCSDIIWTTDDQAGLEDRSGFGPAPRKYNASNVSKSSTKKTKMRKNRKSPPKNQSELRTNCAALVTLKDLNEHDKQKIAQLIKELAKAGTEKENVMRALDEERHKFVFQVQKMEEERLALMGKQELLTEEVKQCQQLLQYYQNLISMQQASIQAQEESKIQSEPLSQMHVETPLTRNGESLSSIGFQSPDDIRVDDVNDTDDSDLTNNDIMRMSARQYKDFLCRKKEKLKKEQECLRKLLLEAGERLNHSKHSPVYSQTVHSSGPRYRSVETQINFSPTPAKSPPNFSGKKSPPILLQIDTPGPYNHSTLLPESSVQSLANSSTKSRKEPSPGKILDLLSKDLQPSYSPHTSYVNQSFQKCETNLGRLAVDGVSSTQCDDDSQILQDIFFVL